MERYNPPPPERETDCREMKRDGRRWSEGSGGAKGSSSGYVGRQEWRLPEMW